jgi:hypothetical protein
MQQNNALNGEAGIGHNNPPINEVLKDQYKEMIWQIKRLEDAAFDLPSRIESDAQVESVQGFVQKARPLLKQVEDTRTREKEPHLSAGRTVDLFFKSLSDGLTRALSDVQARVNAYTAAKLEAERVRREQEARALREEAEKARREAEAALRAQSQERETMLKGSFDSEVVQASALAERADMEAAAAQRAANASAADMSRLRTQSGVVSAQEVLDFEITDLNRVDLEALRPYLPFDAIEKAVRSFIRQHKDTKQIAGVRIFKTIKARM